MSLFLTLMLTLRILVSLLSTLNIFHILHEVKNAKIRDLYWKKRKKMEFGRLQIEGSVSPPECKPPLLPQILACQIFPLSVYTCRTYYRDFTVYQIICLNFLTASLIPISSN